MLNRPRKRMTEVLGAYETKLKSEQQRGALSRNLTFREYANGQVLFRGADAEDALTYYGPGGQLQLALERCREDFRQMTQTKHLQVALTLDEQTNKFIFVMVYLQPGL